MTDSRAYDDRDGWIWLDGELVPWREANVHVLTHALHYASSVFEGQRAYRGEIFKLTEHSTRLRKSASLLGFEIPWSVAEIDAACREVLAAQGLVDAYMRPLAWRGSEQMGVSAQKNKIHLAIACWDWGNYFSEEAVREGLKLDISPWRRPAPYTAPTESKAAGLYMICTLARHAAQAKGLDDALMLDWRGQVAEATGANAFFVRDGELHTPIPDCFLNGITRQTVIELAGRRGIKVHERAIWPEELASFEQFFITGIAAEVSPVSCAGPWTFEVGDLTLQMRSDYLDLVNRRISNT
ncbi:MAG TPA: branched-chain amino acid aminotransferase [Allosphingosinicella sp.]|nr:branched-chain amino acid aminotransferase [Allosphingosinicella sp.]